MPTSPPRYTPVQPDPRTGTRTPGSQNPAAAPVRPGSLSRAPASALSPRTSPGVQDRSTSLAHTRSPSASSRRVRSPVRQLSVAALTRSSVAALASSSQNPDGQRGRKRDRDAARSTSLSPSNRGSPSAPKSGSQDKVTASGSPSASRATSRAPGEYTIVEWILAAALEKEELRSHKLAGLAAHEGVKIFKSRGLDDYSYNTYVAAHRLGFMDNFGKTKFSTFTRTMRSKQKDAKTYRDLRARLDALKANENQQPTDFDIAEAEKAIPQLAPRKKKSSSNISRLILQDVILAKTHNNAKEWRGSVPLAVIQAAEGYTTTDKLCSHNWQEWRDALDAGDLESGVPSIKSRPMETVRCQWSEKRPKRAKVIAEFAELKGKMDRRKRGSATPSK